MTVGVVSRFAELRAVAELLDSASVGPSRLVFEGEPGIGKTTLWSAGLEAAQRRGFRVLSTRPTAAESMLAYASLADMLWDVDASTWSDLPEPQRLGVDRVLLRTSVDGVATEARAVAAGFLSVVTRLAGSTPIMLAIDDVQWVDSSSLAALSFALRRLSGRVAFLATRRLGPPDNRVRGQEFPIDDVRRIQLKSMDLAGIRAVVGQSLERTFARPTMARIHQISGGNPLYAIELARAIDGASDDARLPLPGTLSELVKARIDGLPADVHAALLAAASMSSPTVELVARAVGSGHERVVELLESTAAQDIVSIVGAGLRFSHPLLAWGIYTSAAPADRRLIHRRLSEALDEPELRARHLALAATGPDAHTLQALDTAADLARRRGAPTAAAELLTLALSLGGDTEPRRIFLADNLFTAGDSIAAQSHLDVVVARSPRGVLRAEALTMLAVLNLSDGSWSAGARLLDEALGDATGDMDQRARVLILLSLIQLNAGNLEASQRHVTDAVVGAADSDDPLLLSQALGMQAVVGFLLGYGYDAEALLRATQLESSGPPMWVQLRPGVHRAALSAWIGQLDDARHAFLDIRRDLIERNAESDLMFVVFLSVLTDIWRGDLDTARSAIDDALERSMQLDGALPRGVARMLRALLDAYAGREADTRFHAEIATAAIESSGSIFLRTWLATAIGMLEVSLGNHRAALDAFADPLSRVRAAPRATEIFSAGFLPDALEAMVRLGRHDDAEPLIDRLEENGRRLDRAWMLAVGARCRAILLTARGQTEAAAAVVDAALTEHDRLPMPFERARTLLVKGGIQRRRRQKEAAAATFTEALNIFEQVGTALWADRARLELSGARPLSELTPAEHKVAELLASGMTRKEVAAELFISPKTVEAHLAHIYRKLGIRTRAELGRYVATAKS